MHTATANRTKISTSIHVLPTPPSAMDLLQSLYRHAGPYVSVYVEVDPQRDDAAELVAARWQTLRTDLASQGASQRSLEAIDARVVLPTPADTAGMCIIAADDGHTVVDHALEPPRQNVAFLDTLPYVAPLLEWNQRRVPHVVVTVDETGADIVSFGTQHDAAVSTIEANNEPASLAVDIATRVEAFGARLVVLAGDHDICRNLMHALSELVDPNCRVLVDDTRTVDDLADATVRYVLDTAARDTVTKLREFRFLASHEDAVEGTAATVQAVTSGTPDVLLIHDDPNDQRRIWTSATDPSALCIMKRENCDVQARFIDAIIRSAICQGMMVHIIPTTGPAGPAGDIAALTSTPAPAQTSAVAASS